MASSSSSEPEYLGPIGEGPSVSKSSVVGELGNTSSASMGIALDELRRSNLISSGDYIILPAFAAGFTWGAALYRAI